MISMKKIGTENPMGDEILERNKNLNRGFRKLAPVKSSFGGLQSSISRGRQSSQGSQRRKGRRSGGK